jgi:hypothetical protein
MLIMTTQLSKTSNLYEHDYLQWIENTVERLRNRDFENIDLENLIEEIETLGRSEKRELESRLTILLMHLLKYKYQSSKRSNSWLFTIREQRLRILKSFQDSPSLKNYFQNIFSEIYSDARALAADETGLNIDTFPRNSPFNIESVLNSDWLPETKD